MEILPAEIVIAPPSIYLFPLKELLDPSSGIALSAQNCALHVSGAYTGETSPHQLVDAGVPWVILGHSERRSIYYETDDVVAKKTKLALESGLNVILCCGETLEEREKGNTIEVVQRHLGAVAAEISDWR